MVEVKFAKAFRRHVDCPDAIVASGSLASVLGEYFASHPAVRGYVLDDTGAVRQHVTVFHNDDPIVDRVALTDAIRDGDRLHVFQALSGG